MPPTKSSVQHGQGIALSKLSPIDKPWDTHRAQVDKVQSLYSQTVYDRYASRLSFCSGVLEFGMIRSGDELTLKLKSARYCHLRHCPVCQWRRSLMWKARFYQAVPTLVKENPNLRYIFLTLTVPNCEIVDLRITLKSMSRAYDRMSKRKAWPAIGVVRKMEVTRNHKDNTAHPHYHCLIAVDKHYFSGRTYLSQAKLSAMWTKAMKSERDLRVDVRTVKPRKLKPGQERVQYLDDPNLNSLCCAVVETCAYSVKPEDLIGQETSQDALWLEELTTQLANQRTMSLSGIFRKYLSDKEPENLTTESQEEAESTQGSLYFGWNKPISKYLQVNN